LERIAVIDFETTGITPSSRCRATEIAVVILEHGQIVDRYQSLMKTGVHVPAFIEQLTGISNAMLRSAPPAERVMNEVNEFVGTTPLMAHNAAFDQKFWDFELGLIRRTRLQKFACSLLLARRHLVRVDDHPVELGASWFLPADATGTTLMEERGYGRPLYQEVEEQTGRRYVTGTDQLTARLPTRDEAAQLFIRPDTPVLHLLHIGFDGAHKPIEVAQATWPGPMTSLVETYPVPGPLDDTDPAVGLD